MIYEAKNIDTKKALEFLNEEIFATQTKQARETEKVLKYYEGYRDGLNRARDIFYCSNYEKKGGKNENNKSN